MKAKEFKEVNLRIAENQDEYETLPVHHDICDGTVLMCFELDDDEKKQIAETGEMWIKIKTFNMPLQPIAMFCTKNELLTK